ncbi:hypothetical protein ACFV2L_00845 [Streptomyces sp. NPDC059687]|uniref:hypothetical protein n=1 Tax=unclassified Streptomyces TaxID=2593676 RepID=UPI0033AEF2B2
MLEKHQWEEYAADPDRFVKILEKQEEETRRELHQLRLELHFVKQLSRQREKTQEWQRNGVPDHHRPAWSAADDLNDGGGKLNGHARGRTRKERILGLMAQDPERIWKVNDVSSSLDDFKIKSLRVAMDELARAGSITKHAGANYQFSNPPHQSP